MGAVTLLRSYAGGRLVPYCSWLQLSRNAAPGMMPRLQPAMGAEPPPVGEAVVVRDVATPCRMRRQSSPSDTGQAGRSTAAGHESCVGKALSIRYLTISSQWACGAVLTKNRSTHMCMNSCMNSQQPRQSCAVAVEAVVVVTKLVVCCTQVLGSSSSKTQGHHSYTVCGAGCQAG